MASKICCLTLCADSAGEKATSLLNSIITEYSAQGFFFADFQDRRSLLKCLSSQYSQTQTAVLASAPEHFNSLKLALLRIFAPEIEKSEEIASKLREKGITGREFNCNCAIPQDAKVFISGSGINSGFAFKAGAHVIILIPIEEGFLENAGKNGFTEFYNSVSAVSKRAMSREEVEKSVGNTILSLAENGKRLSIANAGSCMLLLNSMKAQARFDEVFIPDEEKLEMQEDEDVRKFAARCAKTTCDNLCQDAGIAISDIVEEEDGTMHATVAISDSKNARIREVFSCEHDDKKALLYSCIYNLLEMMDDFAGEGSLDNPFARSEKKKKISIIAIIVAAAVLAAVAICTGIALKMRGSRAESSEVANAVSGEVAEAIEFREEESVPQESAGEEYYEDYVAPAPQSSKKSTASSFISKVFGSDKKESSPAPVIKDEPAEQTTAKSVTATEAKKVAETTDAVTETTGAVTTTATVTDAVTTVISTIAATTLKNEEPATTKAVSVEGILKSITLPVTTRREESTTEKVTKTGKGEEDKEETTEKNTTLAPVKGTFTFTSYGYGHGVGMSQIGAIEFAKQGKTYQQIVTHYYSGTTVKADPNTPATVKYNGTEIDLLSFLCRNVAQEIGYTTATTPVEAMKAQACATYTFLKFHNYSVSTGQVAYKYGFDYTGTAVEGAVKDFLATADGSNPVAKYVDYNGKAALTVYFASAAGKTTDSKSVWGNSYPYLVSVSSPEKAPASTFTISAEDLRKRILAADSSIVLPANPAKWLKIISQAEGAQGCPGYIAEIGVGNKSFKGNAFRTGIMGGNIKSHAFTWTYTP